jgi:hypothetical protein
MRDLKILFFSMHGCAAQEITILCKESGVGICFPRKDESGGVRTLTEDAEHGTLTGLGAEIIQTSEEVRDRFASGEFTAVMLANPRQIREYNSTLSVLRPGTPFIIRHGLNSFTKFRNHGTKNFLTCSQQAIYAMDECNCFLSRKLIPWKIFPRGGWAEDRRGFASYIHHYQKHYPGEYVKFREMSDDLGKKGLSLKNFGYESPNGMVDDLSEMTQSIATVHLKGGNALCNAVIRSMAVGTPVLMDQWTYVRCFFDQVKGIIVTDDLVGDAVRLAEDEDYLEEKIEETLISAKKQFSWDEDLGERFVKFLENLR